MLYMLEQDPKEREINKMLKWLADNNGLIHKDKSNLGVYYRVRINATAVTAGYDEPLTALHAAYDDWQNQEKIEITTVGDQQRRFTTRSGIESFEDFE